ncbi:hypothetical protein L9F63_020105, partial [Diploptera punctata]
LHDPDTFREMKIISYISKSADYAISNSFDSSILVNILFRLQLIGLYSGYTVKYILYNEGNVPSELSSLYYILADSALVVDVDKSKQQRLCSFISTCPYVTMKNKIIYDFILSRKMNQTGINATNYHRIATGKKKIFLQGI